MAYHNSRRFVAGPDRLVDVAVFVNLRLVTFFNLPQEPTDTLIDTEFNGAIIVSLPAFVASETRARYMQISTRVLCLLHSNILGKFPPFLLCLVRRVVYEYTKH